MAEASGDAVVVETPGGPVEARRMGRAEAGASRRRVAFPRGAETFFGTSADLIAHARRRITGAAAEDALGRRRGQARAPSPRDAPPRTRGTAKRRRRVLHSSYSAASHRIWIRVPAAAGPSAR